MDGNMTNPCVSCTLFGCQMDDACTEKPWKCTGDWPQFLVLNPWTKCMDKLEIPEGKPAEKPAEKPYLRIWFPWNSKTCGF